MHYFIGQLQELWECYGECRNVNLSQQRQALERKRSNVKVKTSQRTKSVLTLYRMVMPIGTPFLKEKINN